MVLSLAPAGGLAREPSHSALLELHVRFVADELSNLLGGRASGRPYSPLNETSKQKYKIKDNESLFYYYFSSLYPLPFALL